ncbi:TVP38/TMEM64 family protein [Dendrosporobacter sp. 1207_IL3150]|uniref:TVP38/TMEM64 family protein n=1 Tax=Dendrosporobacter sp. 1207_IL3150 TaxID=3084054 RepID=UPI002FD99AEF
MNHSEAKSTLLLKIGVLVLIIAAYMFLPGIEEFVVTGIGFLKSRDFYGLRLFVLSYGIWAPVTSIVLMAIQSLVPFVPGVVITIANAWIFGWQYGAIYSWIGALIGAVLDFGIARWYGRPVVENIINNKYLQIVDKYLTRHGILAVLITRIIPILPFKVISYSAGLTLIPSRQFIIATGIGQMPGIILYSIIGQNLNHSLDTALLITILLIFVAILVYHNRVSIERYFLGNSKP